ncbi:hypothetical protein ARAM_001464 [Aspergillus rambellii]|uniref:WW domain-containing protein n=1 Tax=Aspergillus rambellii TaxID=308745 RepID=A0A0F8V4K9_9EURO|nr:hypothetical protein ARAM_001464 [Aspergillus rambellii]
MSASPARDAPDSASAARSPPAEPERQGEEFERDDEKGAQETLKEGKDTAWQEREEGEEEEEGEDGEGEEEEEEEEGETKETEPDTDAGTAAPPLPDQIPPPLPKEAPPSNDDGWEPVWDANAQAYYFFNRYTGVSQWENPRVPAATTEETTTEEPAENPSPVLGGYNPAIHGDYDPTAPYAQMYEQPQEGTVPAGAVAPGITTPANYEAAGSFNRFTGRWQAASQNGEYHNDENKSRRQMNAYFDVDAAANSHDGRSLRAERSAKKLSKKELKMFKEKRREKKEEKRRAWLRD